MPTAHPRPIEILTENKICIPVTLAASNLAPLLVAKLFGRRSQPFECSCDCLSFKKVLYENMFQCIRPCTADVLVHGKLSC